MESGARGGGGMGPAGGREGSGEGKRDAGLRGLAAFLALSSVAVLGVALGHRHSVPITVLAFGAVWTVLLGWSNGANDAANSMGAAVGAGALTLRQAVLAGAAAEVTGASLLGVHVSNTISKGVIRTNDYVENPSEFSFAMVAVLVGAAVTTITATYYKLPISATHGVTGGLIGVGAMAHGWGSLGGGAIARTVASWVISPVLGGLVAFALFLLVHRLVFRAGNPLRNSRRMQPFFTGLTSCIVALFLLLKGPVQVCFWKEGTFTAPLLVSLGFGGLAAGITLLSRRGDGGDDDGEGPLLAKGLPPGGYGTMPRGAGEEEGVEGQDEDRLQCSEQPFCLLLVLTSLSVAFAHGANDVANSAGPFAVLLEGFRGAVKDEPDIPIWVVVAAGSCMSVGILTWGHKTIRTVSNKITVLSPSKAFAVQLGAAVSVLTSSVVEMPVSTSHCLVGAVIGVGFAERVMGKGNKIDWGVLSRIAVSWAATIPAAMAIACAIFAAERSFV